jgi:cytochrome c oxidase cbb3-type subunit 1
MSLVGVMAFMVSLWAAGVVQAEDWTTGGIPFMETVRALKPYILVRLLGGSILGAGQCILVYNLFRSLVTAEAGRSFSEAER